MSLRIAILLTNTDRSALAHRHPDDARKVSAWLTLLRPQWQCTTFRAIDGELPDAAAAFDAFVIPGSVASVNDDEPWIDALLALIRELHERHRPIGGLCFGHQAIARALGGQVGPNPGGFRVGVAPTRFTQHRPWMAPHPSSLSLYAAHDEQILQPPPSTDVLGGDSFCPVGALAIGDHVFSTQYHPELPAGFMRELTQALAAQRGTVATADALDQIERLPVQPLLWMRWLVQFIEQAAAKRP